jgi:hypothetical protein
VRGGGIVTANNAVNIVVTTNNGTSYVTGNFALAGCSIVFGARAPKQLCDQGKRSEYIVSSVSNTPAFKGQRAYISGTGKWYMAAATSSSADWIILN